MLFHENMVFLYTMLWLFRVKTLVVTNPRGTEENDKANDLFEICLLHDDAFDNY